MQTLGMQFIVNFDQIGAVNTALVIGFILLLTVLRIYSERRRRNDDNRRHREYLEQKHQQGRRMELLMAIQPLAQTKPEVYSALLHRLLQSGEFDAAGPLEILARFEEVDLGATTASRPQHGPLDKPAPVEDASPVGVAESAVLELSRLSLTVSAGDIPGNLRELKYLQQAMETYLKLDPVKVKPNPHSGTFVPLYDEQWPLLRACARIGMDAIPVRYYTVDGRPDLRSRIGMPSVFVVQDEQRPAPEEVEATDLESESIADESATEAAAVTIAHLTADDTSDAPSGDFGGEASEGGNDAGEG